jgi:hypothetical protein
MKHGFILSTLLFLLVGGMSSCEVIPDRQNSQPIQTPLNSTSLMPPRSESLSFAVEKTDQASSYPMIETPEPKPALTISKISSPALTIGITATIVHGEVETVNTGPFAGWYQYSHPKYNFSLYFPPDWEIVEESAHHVLISTTSKWTLVIGFKGVEEKGVVIHRTGVAAGELVNRGAVNFIGSPLSREVLVYQGKDKAVLYQNALEVTREPIVFTISLNNFDPDIDYERVDLPIEIQEITDQIVESFELIRE